VNLPPATLAGTAAVAVVFLGIAIIVLRRSLLAVAFGVALATLGLALGAHLVGAAEVAGVVVAVGVAGAIGLSSAAVAVHRRRGADFVDELRELGGG
jgi:hydrogenase-4 membrane subunit HyfE